METIEYRTIDKSAWDEGVWQSEPDKKQWRDKATGLPCLIVRNHAGALCGYVGVTSDHPAYGLHYDGRTRRAVKQSHREFKRETKERYKNNDYDFAKSYKKPRRSSATVKGVGEAIAAISVHGGLTFADKCREGDECNSICHKHTGSEPVQWFGFDCSHAGDFNPRVQMAAGKVMPLSFGDDDDIYRDFAYVTSEVEPLAQQLAAIGSEHKHWKKHAKKKHAAA